MEAQNTWKGPWKACLYALPLWVAVLLTCCALFGCKTNEAGQKVVDWPKIDVLGDEALSLLDGQIKLRPEKAEKLGAARAIVAKVDLAVDGVTAGGEPPGGFAGTLETAIAALDALVNDTGPGDEKLLADLLLARGALGLAKVLIA